MNSINNSINFLNIDNNYISNTKQYPYHSITSETNLKHNINLHTSYLDYDKQNTNVSNSTNIINKNNFKQTTSFYTPKNLPTNQIKAYKKRHKKLTYDHYIINCNQVIKPSDIYNLNINDIKPPDVKINKIRKHLFRYIRVSLAKSLSEISRKHIINSIENRLNAKLKLQKLNRNLDLERIKINNSNLSKLMTLNINGVTNKLPELKLLLSKYQPGIICLQETGRT
ncbi:hypothetical protein COBT_000600, partial [Conglomerata obtusa]